MEQFHGHGRHTTQLVYFKPHKKVGLLLVFDDMIDSDNFHTWMTNSFKSVHWIKHLQKEAPNQLQPMVLHYSNTNSNNSHNNDSNNSSYKPGLRINIVNEDSNSYPALPLSSPDRTNSSKYTSSRNIMNDSTLFEVNEHQSYDEQKYGNYYNNNNNNSNHRNNNNNNNNNNNSSSISTDNNGSKVKNKKKNKNKDILLPLPPMEFMDSKTDEVPNWESPDDSDSDSDSDSNNNVNMEDNDDNDSSYESESYDQYLRAVFSEPMSTVCNIIYTYTIISIGN